MIQSVIVHKRVKFSLIRNPIAHTQPKLLRETAVWSVVNHPNITPFLGVSFDFDRPGMPCFVAPYCRHGNVLRYLKENKEQNIDKLSPVNPAILI